LATIAERIRGKQGLDLDKVRRDPAYFAERLLNVKLHGYQKAILRDTHATTVWVAGRGSGKTLIAMIWALWKCFTERNYRVCYIAARFGQAKIAQDVAMGMIAGTPLYSSITELSAERIRFSNGSTIHFIPGGNPVAARGFHNLIVREGEQETGIAVVIDEAACVPRDTYTAAVSIINTAAEGKGKKLIVGSPLGTNHWFHDEWLAGNDLFERHTKSFHTSSEAVPHVSRSFLDEHKTKLTPIEYRAEIMAQFQDALNSFFGDYIDKAVKQYAIPLPALDDCEYYLGIDMSTSARAGSDFTVLVVIERWRGGTRWEPVKEESCVGRDVDRLVHVPEYVRIAHLRRFQYLDFAGLKNEIRDIKRRFPNISRAFSETYESTQLRAIFDGGEGLWMPFEQISPTNPLQREAFPYLHWLLREGILQLPAEGEHVTQLLKEFKSFQCKVTEAGNITYGGIAEEKDDCIYALCWPLWGSKKHYLPLECV